MTSGTDRKGARGARWGNDDGNGIGLLNPTWPLQIKDKIPCDSSDSILPMP